MKKLMLLGGLIGFLIGLLVGLAVPGRTAPSLLLQACASALAGGLLLRWWGAQWRRCLHLATVERQQALQRAAVKTNGKSGN
jgi:hypothetical protein